MIRVTVIDEHGDETVEEYAKPKLIIGRLPTNDIVLPAGHISKRHAAVDFDPNQATFLLTDLNSANGVRVNGERIDGKREFTTDDEIRLGPFVLRFAAGDEAGATNGTGQTVNASLDDEWAEATPQGDDFDDFDAPAGSSTLDSDFEDDGDTPRATDFDDFGDTPKAADFDGFDAAGAAESDFDDFDGAPDIQNDGFEDYGDTPSAAPSAFDDFDAPGAVDDDLDAGPAGSTEDGFDDFNKVGENDFGDFGDAAQNEFTAVAFVGQATTGPKGVASEDAPEAKKPRHAEGPKRTPRPQKAPGHPTGPRPDGAPVQREKAKSSQDQAAEPPTPFDLLQRYIALDEQRRLAVVGRDCHCGRCLLCESRYVVRRVKKRQRQS